MEEKLVNRTAERIDALWAKLPRRGEPEDGYHPLLAHMIDVAQVAHAMWRTVLPPAARAHVTCAMGLGDDQVTAGSWVAFLAGLHDLGKASPAFARQDTRAWERIRAAGFPCPPDPSGGRLPHGWITAHALRTLLSAPPYALPPPVASVAGVAVGGHHGVFPSPSLLKKVTMEPREAGQGQWKTARQHLVRELAAALGYPAPAPAHLALDLANAMYLAGLTSVADWIGSNADFFPYVVTGEEPSAGLLASEYWAKYAARAATQARDALTALGWLGATAPATPVAFAELFPFPANALQAAAVDVAAEIDGPALVVIEAPMGLGKTEAALYLADYFAASLGQRGFYLALPTQATSNQMLSRLRPFLARRYPDEIVNLQLLHGHAALSAEFEILRQHAGDRLYGGVIVHDDEQEISPDAHVLAAQWFTYRKRGLLAPFGVGTVDQALLAVLQTKHVFVRLFGLAHTVVIIDEVHAYDTYMSALLGRLLEWLAALGASVILLSATLPRCRREQLLRAYAAGRDARAPLPVTSPVPYPRITWAAKGQIGARAVALASKTVKVAIATIDDPFADDDFERAATALADRLASALREGGCVAIIVSTVRRAQRLYRVLHQAFGALAEGERPALDLFHARYLFGDRDGREKRALHQFGKPSARVVFDDGSDEAVDRPHRAVLIATQVIEQSLDLDFDLMVTDLAPADLVLQRIGRLHRHVGRTRPVRLRVPTLWLLLPPTVNGVPRFGRDQVAIYDAHTLLRSWIALHGLTHIRLPDDIEPIVEAVYDDREPSTDLSPAVLATWNETRADLDASIAKAEHEAETRWIASPKTSRQIWELLRDPREEDAPENHPAHQALTRLAELTAPVVMLYGSLDRPSLDPDGRQPVDLRAVPDLDLAQRLLRRSVALSDRRIVYALAAQKPPSSWQRSALLRHHRLIILDPDGCGTIDARHTIRLDPDLGIVVDE